MHVAYHQPRSSISRAHHLGENRFDKKQGEEDDCIFVPLSGTDYKDFTLTFCSDVADDEVR